MANICSVSVLYIIKSVFKKKINTIVQFNSNINHRLISHFNNMYSQNRNFLYLNSQAIVCWHRNSIQHSRKAFCVLNHAKTQSMCDAERAGRKSTSVEDRKKLEKG